MPLLLIHADTDHAVPVANAYARHRQAPRANLCIYAGIRHAVAPMHTQVSKRLLADLRPPFAVRP